MYVYCSLLVETKRKLCSVYLFQKVTTFRPFDNINLTFISNLITDGPVPIKMLNPISSVNVLSSFVLIAFTSKHLQEWRRC
jgi:hypothetical protein